MNKFVKKKRERKKINDSKKNNNNNHEAEKKIVKKNPSLGGHRGNGYGRKITTCSGNETHTHNTRRNTM